MVCNCQVTNLLVCVTRRTFAFSKLYFLFNLCKMQKRDTLESINIMVTSMSGLRYQFYQLYCTFRPSFSQWGAGIYYFANRKIFSHACKNNKIRMMSTLTLVSYVKELVVHEQFWSKNPFNKFRSFCDESILSKMSFGRLLAAKEESLRKKVSPAQNCCKIFLRAFDISMDCAAILMKVVQKQPKQSSAMLYFV